MSTDTDTAPVPTPPADAPALTPLPPQPPDAPAPSWRQAKPNELFAEEIRYLIRFAVHPKAVRCAVCKRRAKVMWSMVCPFVAHTMTGVVLVPSVPLEPLTLVCDVHPLSPRADVLAVLEGSL